MKKGIILVSTCILFIMLISPSSCDNSELSLQAHVFIDNYTFAIQNTDSFIWYNVEMFVNYEGDDLSSGYKYETGSMLPYLREYIRGLDFINIDGVRYNPWKYDPTKLLIRAETEDGRIGTYVIEW